MSKCTDVVSDTAFDNNSVGCSSKSGFSFFVISAAPTPDQITKICATPSCTYLVSLIKAAQPSECVVPFGLLLYGEVINPIEAVCSGKILAAPAPTATPAPAPPTTPASAPLTRSPSPEAVEKPQSMNKTIVILTGTVAMLVLVIAVLCFGRYRKRTRPTASKRAEDADANAFAYTEGTTEDSYAQYTNVDLAIAPIDETLAIVRIPFRKIRVGDVISIGGYGEVAYGSYNKQDVAIKRLLADRRKNPISIKSFFAEIKLTSTLEHECIVQFIGVAWETLADLCMVSEFMPGGDLRLLLARYASNGHPNGYDGAKLKMALQVAHALTYLHTLQTPVVHRDLKSRNILLSAKGDAKLIDFGISCERQDVTMTAGVGSSLWMAPEVMLGQRYDEKADVFSLGVILSELDTHDLPYNHARDLESDWPLADMVLMQLISEGKLQPRFTEAANPKIVELARECLVLDPTARPRVSEVLFRIHECRENELVS